MMKDNNIILQGNNPLLMAWDTPHQTPPFSRIKTEHYKPAIAAAIEEGRHNVQAIIDNSEPPSFANTIEALERSTQTLGRITGLLFNLNECDTTDEMQQVVLDVVPDLSRFETEVSMNEDLFARVKEVYDHRGELSLSAEQQMLLDDTYKGFVRHGVGLPEERKRRFAEVEERLSVLTQQFNQNVLADNNAYTLHLTDEAALAGLPENSKHAAREEAERRGLEGWLFTLAFPSYGPFMKYAERRDLREQMWRAYNSRGNHGDGNDNNAIISEIVRLRNEKALLLGYATYCDYVLEERMVGSLPNLREFMQRLTDAAMPAARRDVREVTEYAYAHGLKDNPQTGGEWRLMPWDFSFYAERLKQERYAFDSEVLRPYLSLERVRQGIFDLYGRLYGLRFVAAPHIEVYNPEAEAFEVFDGDRLMGVLYMDMHPRASKRSGAWMTEFRGQWHEGDRDIRPLIQIVCNFTRAVGERPSLLTIDEVETFMHEFGHAMHGMMSEVGYESLSGTNVLRDFVELPSQLMENWCRKAEFLGTFAYHYETGEPMPAEYIELLQQSEQYLSGYLCVRQLNYGKMDMLYHTTTSDPNEKAEELERRATTELLPHIEGCCSSTAFTHIFSGGYASGYYGYKWAEVLDADVFSRFEQEGIFNRDTAMRLRRELLSKGGSVHPATLFRNFMGRDPDIKAFMKRSGFERGKI